MKRKIKELSEKNIFSLSFDCNSRTDKRNDKNDIEIGLKYFKAITINVFVDNGTMVKEMLNL